MDELFKEQVEELNRCRSDYSSLFQNFKQARVIFEEKEQAKNAQFHIALSKIEALQKKVDGQRRKIAIQKAERGAFENDVDQLKYASDLLGMRERSLWDTQETATAQIAELTRNVNAQSVVIDKQANEIRNLKKLILNETVPKTDSQQLKSEIDTMMIVMQDEMISLRTHQQVKEKYADLQCRVEWDMVAVHEYNAVAAEVLLLKTKLEMYVPTDNFNHLQEKYQHEVKEKETAVKNLQHVSEGRDDALQSLSALNLRYQALESHTNKIERELIESKIREDVMITDIEQIRCDYESADNCSRVSLDRIVLLETEHTALSEEIDRYRQQSERDIETVAKSEMALKQIKDAYDRKETALRDEINSLRTSSLVEDEKNTLKFEFNSIKSTEELKIANAAHSTEIKMLNDKYNDELVRMYAEMDTARQLYEAGRVEQIQALEEGHKNTLNAVSQAHKINEETSLLEHKNLVESLKIEHANEIRAIITDQQLCLESSLIELQQKHHEEFIHLQASHNNTILTLTEECECLRIEKRREEIKVDLERIRAEAALAELKTTKNIFTSMTSRFESDLQEAKREGKKQNIASLILNENYLDVIHQIENEKIEIEIVKDKNVQSDNSRGNSQREINKEIFEESNFTTVDVRSTYTEYQNEGEQPTNNVNPNNITSNNVHSNNLNLNNGKSSPKEKSVSVEEKILSIPTTQNRSIEKIMSLRDTATNRERDKDRDFDDNIELLRISRSLEDCSFSQLIQIAARGVLNETSATPTATPQPYLPQYVQTPQPSEMFSPVFMPSFGSPGGVTYSVSTPSRNQSQSQNTDTRMRSSLSRVQGSPSPLVHSDSHTDSNVTVTVSPGLVPFDSVRDVVITSSSRVNRSESRDSDESYDSKDRRNSGARRRSGSEGGSPHATHRHSLNSSGGSGSGSGSASGGSGSGSGSNRGPRLGDLNWSEKTDQNSVRDLPPYITSPPATPSQSYRRYSPSISSSNGNRSSSSILGPGTGLGLGPDEKQREREITSQTQKPISSLPLGFVPPSPSREELLDRLINLTKEARGTHQGPLPSFLYAPPL